MVFYLSMREVLTMVLQVLATSTWPAITRHQAVVKDVLRMVLCRSRKLQGRVKEGRTAVVLPHKAAE